MAVTNFLQHNPGAANQENDATYASDSTRTGGIGVDQILPSPWLNKVWYQSSTFVTAMANMLVTKGISTSDANLAALATVLAAIITLADFVTTLAATGNQQTPDGVIRKWGITSGLSGGGGSVGITFSPAFPTACYGVQLTTIDLGGGDRISFVSGVSRTGFTANNNGSNAEAYWEAVGH